MSSRLALFPLDTVLFPGSLLPLHIFEPRYRRLLADALEGDKRFGLVPLGPEGARPSTGVIGTVALIRAAQPLPDGRSNIVVSGERRFMLRRYIDEDTPYPVGLVDSFDDDESDRPEAEGHLPELRRLADRCLEALAVLTDAASKQEWSSDPGELSFQIAGILRLETEFKQRFLGIRSAAQRTGLLLQVLPDAVADLEARAVVRRRADRNGTGGEAPDITQPES
ncbi:MAG TPA: LON peptidase substrate-binding domain-containing protein [Gemmatimonadales bacterium]